MNHTQVGDITEYKFILYCMENNIPISKPLNTKPTFIIYFNSFNKDAPAITGIAKKNREW